MIKSHSSSVFAPLRFLTLRYINNSIYRAFQSPMRAIATVLLAVILLLALAGSIINAFFNPALGEHEIVKNLPIKEVTGFLSAVHLMIFFSGMAMAGGKRSNKFSVFLQGDVNYVFTSPLEKFKVFRILLILRGSFVLLLIVLWAGFYSLMWGGSALGQLLFSEHTLQRNAAQAMYMFLLLPMLLSSLFLGATLSILELQGRRSWKIFWSVITALVAPCIFFLAMGGKQSLDSGEYFITGVVHALDHPVVVWLLFPLRGLADAALARVNGWTPTILPAFAFWGMFCIISHEFLRKQSPWFYEYAAGLAQRGAEARAQRKTMFMWRTDWTKKKVEKGRNPVSQLRILRIWNPTGVWALLWRDLTISLRMSGAVTMFFLFSFVILYPIAIIVVQSYFYDVSTALKFLYGFCQSLICLYTLTEMTLIENLKRVDIQKTFPFSSRATVLVSALSALIPFATFEIILFVITAIVLPAKWGILLYVLFVSCSFVFTAALSLLFIEINNPDQSDYVQRVILGMARLPVFLLAIIPGGISVTVGFVLPLPMFLNALVTIFINALVSVTLVVLCAKKYERFNPVD